MPSDGRGPGAIGRSISIARVIVLAVVGGCSKAGRLVCRRTMYECEELLACTGRRKCDDEKIELSIQVILPVYISQSLELEA